ncbi:MAG: hypothetical protein IKE91_06215 [Clostridia bacterium]|nr:hypothetical protein [Clostridia bacterium]
MDSLIRWKRQDSVRLSRAINRFNNQIRKLDKSRNIPSKITYEEARDKFVTRREFESLINSLNRADEQTLDRDVELASGEKITYWEYSESLRKKNIAGANLLNELDRINRERAESGNRYMGEERISEIQATLDLLDSSYDSLYNFNKRKRQREFLGRTDYETSRNKLFMQNFLKAAKNLQNFKNYDVLMRKIKSIKNPNKFYEVMKKSTILMDIFLWYKDDDGSLVYSTFDTNEQAFDTALKEDLELDIDVD